MAKRRGRKVQFTLKVGEDPTSWRFGSLQEALQANTGLISHLIKAGEDRSDTHEKVKLKDGPPTSESA